MVYLKHNESKTPFIEVIQELAYERGIEFNEELQNIFGKVEIRIEALHFRFPALSLSEILDILFYRGEN